MLKFEEKIRRQKVNYHRMKTYREVELCIHNWHLYVMCCLFPTSGLPVCLDERLYVSGVEPSYFILQAVAEGLHRVTEVHTLIFSFFLARSRTGIVCFVAVAFHT